MGKKHNFKIITTVIICITALCATSCGQSLEGQNVANSTQEPATDEYSYSTTQAGIYDSEDSAVVVKKDLEEKTLQLQNITSSRRYTLKYDGTTTIYDKNEQALTMEQLREGSVVDVRFYKPTRALAYVKENTDCVSLSGVSNYTMDLEKGTITVGKDVYNISAHVVVVSDGKETDMMEVNQVDVLSLWGYKNMIYGVSIDSGHGYLRLLNEDYFVDGWLEVGSSIIRKITDDMLIVVPEGTYDVDVSNKGTTATQQITFNRNEEMAWDLGEVEIKQVQTGTIIFTLTPLTATVVIDGAQVDTSKPVTLDYGLHRMQIYADGYDTVSQYIRVAEPSANISVELEKSEEESSAASDSSEKASTATTSDTASTSDAGTTAKKYETSQNNYDDSSTSSSNTTTSSTSQDTQSADNSTTSSSQVASATSKYKVYIDAPSGVEAYLDGNYIGITPVSFEKVAGSYVVSLRKTGYQTRSYTLQVDGEEKDVNYTFSDLLELED